MNAYYISSSEQSRTWWRGITKTHTPRETIYIYIYNRIVSGRKSRGRFGRYKHTRSVTRWSLATVGAVTYPNTHIKTYRDFLGLSGVSRLTSFCCYLISWPRTSLDRRNWMRLAGDAPSTINPDWNMPIMIWYFICGCFMFGHNEQSEFTNVNRVFI